MTMLLALTIPLLQRPQQPVVDSLSRSVSEQKLVAVGSKMDRSELNALFKLRNAKDLEAKSKEKGFSLVKGEKWAFLISESVMPDKVKIKNQLALLNAISSGKAMDGQYLSFANLDSDTRNSLFQAMATIKPALGQVGNPSMLKMRASVGGMLSVSKNGKTISVGVSQAASMFDDDTAVVNTDSSMKPDPVKGPGPIWPLQSDRPSMELVFGGGLSEEDRLAASSELMQYLQKEWSKSTKKLKDALQFALSRLESGNGLIGLNREGNYDDIDSQSKAEIRAKLVGMMGQYGFANESDVDNFLQGATFSKTSECLTLGYISKDKQNGSGINLVTIPIGQIGAN